MLILFFKATHLKEVWIPGFTKDNGVYVGGFARRVHVTDDHDDARVAGGGISSSQKKAHKELSGDSAFNALPVADKAAQVMSHATDIQLAATKGAQATFAKQKLVAGKVPSKSEWSALNSSSSMIGHLADVHAAGKMDGFMAAHAKHGTEPTHSKEALIEKIQSHVNEKEQKKADRPVTGSNKIDPEKDSLITAITKLGGLDKDEAKRQGIDPAYFKTRGFKIFRLFHSNGMTFDDMAHNYLADLGYPVTGANDLLEMIDQELSGSPVFTPEGYGNYAADNYQQDDSDPFPGFHYELAGIDSPGNTYAPEEYEGMSQRDMVAYDLICRLDAIAPDAYSTILIKSQSEGDNAEQLIERCRVGLQGIIDRRGSEQQSGHKEAAGEQAVRAGTGTTAEGRGEPVGNVRSKEVVGSHSLATQNQDADQWMRNGAPFLPVSQSPKVLTTPLTMPGIGELTAYNVRKNGVASDAVKQAPVQRVKINAIVSGQAPIDAHHLKPWTGGDYEPVEIMRYRGVNYLTQGNHRVVSAWADGQEAINARVLNLDAPKNTKYIKPMYR